MTEQLHFHFSLSCIGEGNGNPLQYSCLENPRDRGAWWAAVYGVAQSQTRLKRLSSSSSSSRESWWTHWIRWTVIHCLGLATLLPNRPEASWSKRKGELGLAGQATRYFMAPVSFHHPCDSPPGRCPCPCVFRWRHWHLLALPLAGNVLSTSAFTVHSLQRYPWKLQSFLSVGKSKQTLLFKNSPSHSPGQLWQCSWSRNL